MTTDVLTALFIVVAIATICYIILGIYSLVKGLKNNKVARRWEVSVANSFDSLYDTIGSDVAELGCRPMLMFLRYKNDLRYTDLIKGCIIQALKQGVEYKRKYEALSKAKQLELRKLCIEQHPDKRSYLSERIGYAEILYQYLTTGKQPEKKKEEKS